MLTLKPLRVLALAVAALAASPLAASAAPLVPGDTGTTIQPVNVYDWSRTLETSTGTIAGSTYVFQLRAPESTPPFKAFASATFSFSIPNAIAPDDVRARLELYSDQGLTTRIGGSDSFRQLVDGFQLEVLRGSDAFGFPPMVQYLLVGWDSFNFGGFPVGSMDVDVTVTAIPVPAALPLLLGGLGLLGYTARRKARLA